MLPNFNILEEGKISERFRKKGIHTFHDAVRYIHSLPYGRNRSPEKPFTIIAEGKGTCSTKHACLKALAEENNINSVEFHMSIYSMHEGNTPKVGPILKDHNLEYILEAHTYLCYAQERFDFTHPNTREKPWEEDIIIETSIDADQIGTWKRNYHRGVLADWIQRDNIKYSLDEIWEIREKCIQTLSEK